MNHVLLMAGGVGSRFAEKTPKQYTEINGQPVFWYIVEKYLSVPEIGTITIVTNSQWREFVEEVVKRAGKTERVTVTNGGKTRSESVKNGLIKIADFASINDVVLIHDASHPYVDSSKIAEVISATEKYGGASMASFEYDTCYYMDEEGIIDHVVPRQNLAVGASPEAFRYKEIYDIYINSTEEELNNMTSAGAIAIANGIRMQIVKTDILNLKITYRRDMELFEKLYSSYFFSREGGITTHE